MAKYEQYQIFFCDRTKKYATKLKELVVKDSLTQEEERECQRIAHTINGSAGLMGCKNLQEFAAKVEKIYKEGVKIPKQKINKTLDQIILNADDFDTLNNSSYII